MSEAAKVTKISKDHNTATRVSVLENQVQTLSGNIEKLDQKVEIQYQTLHSRISDLRDDLRNDFESRQEKIIEKIDEHSVHSASQMENIKSKITDLEKWRWMIMGAAVVVGFILAHIDIKTLF